MTNSRLWNDGWEFLMLSSFEEEDHEKHSQKAAALALEAAQAGHAPLGMEVENRPASFQKVDLPHDYLIYDTHNLYLSSIGVYRKSFVVDSLPEDKEILIDFDGVYMDTTVFVNGVKTKEWKYGYSAFQTNITAQLKVGDNQIVVAVNFRNPNSRWYSGAGIYRNVHFVERTKAHIVTDGLYITQKRETEEEWSVTVEAECVLPVFSGKEAICVKLLNGQGRTVDIQSTPLAEKDLITGEAAAEILDYDEEKDGALYKGSLSFQVKNPLLWDIGQGNLYTVSVSLLSEETVLDEAVQRIGFREIIYDAAKGLLVNGRHVKLNGVCEHHDLGSLGAAFNKKAMLRKLCILSGMGVNAVRCAHNMPAREWMDLCDEMGFFMDDEAFDMWERPMTTYDYARYFKQWYKKDVASWIRKDRNRPSVLMWSIGNEIPDTVESAHGREIAEYLVKEVRKHDPKHHAPTTIGSNYMKWDNAINAEKEVELAGYNYSEYLYDEHHERFPEFVIYGSETSSLLESRGIYHFPYSAHVLSDADKECSALGNTVTGWGGKSYEDVICDDRDRDFSLGQFIWTGFDYIGEPTPYDTKNSYFGQIDTAGFPKDAFYIYQSAWTDYRKKPMVHVFPYWDFNLGEIIDVSVCTNAPCVELFVNGVSQGKEWIQQGTDRDFVKRYRVPYAQGELLAICYDEEGKELTRDVEHSFGDAVSLQATIEDTLELAYGDFKEFAKKYECLVPDTALADGEDLKFVIISAVDKDGYPVKNAKNRVSVSVEGPAHLVGLDNGDSADFDAYKGVSRRLFSGLLLAVIRTTKESGTVTIKVKSNGLSDAEVTFVSKKTEKEIDGISCEEKNENLPIYGSGVMAPEISDREEIPIRRITLAVQNGELVQRADGQNVYALTKEVPSVVVEAVLAPLETTYQDMEWCVVTDTGIELPYIHVEEEGKNKVRIKALGDGDFRLRCVAKNGGSCVSVRSEIEFTAMGLGQPFLTPYESVLCGLATETSLQCEAGIDHGVNFLGSDAREEWCYIGFDNLAFGSFGADEVKFYIFANTGDNPVSLRLYSGKPGEDGSELLVDTMYHKSPQWMVFQEECITLPRRLKDGDAFYIATKDSYQMRNFVFTRKEKAYEELSAVSCDALYGDAFTRTDEDIRKIGNNVIIHFEDMNFGEQGCRKLELTAHTDLMVNPVQIRFTEDATGSTTVQMIEVKQSAGYETISYELAETIQGGGTLDLVFLPGSEIDIKTVHFVKE